MTQAEAEVAAAIADAEDAARQTGEPAFVVLDELRGLVFATRTRDPRSYRVLETIQPAGKQEHKGITA